MKRQALNLLRHPGGQPGALWPLARRVLAALAFGVVLGALWSAWQHGRVQALRERQQGLEQRWQQLSGQQAQAVLAAKHADLARQWAQRDQAWRLRRERLLDWQAALQAQAAETGLRARRWQGDARQLTLQAVVPSPDGVTSLLSALRSAGAQDWRLESLSQPEAAGRAAPMLEVTLQAPGWEASAPAARGRP